MSGSNWSDFAKDRLGLTIALFVAAIVGIVTVEVACLEQRDLYDEATRNAAYYAENAKNNISVNCGVEAPTNCAQEINDAARKEQREEYDLYSQRAVALWTAVMGGMAVVGVSLSAVGMYLIWTTFAETRKANVIANKVLEYETRPVAVFDSFVVQKHTSHFEFVATFKNAGRGPLRIRTVRLIQTRIPRPAGRLGAHKKEVIESGGQVDQTIAVGDVFGPNAGTCGRYKPGTHDISLVCEVEYDNPLVFPSKPYRTKASCELLPVITRISATNGPIQQMGDGRIVGDISECEIDQLHVANLVLSKEMT